MNAKISQFTITLLPGLLCCLLVMSFSLASCSAGELTHNDPTAEVMATWNARQLACPVSKPAWARPPEDRAVMNTPDYGYYFLNDDRSMWAAAWWATPEVYELRAGEARKGVKVGWFRPAGETLEISGRRLDGEAPALKASIPCCYQTRFQSTGLYFPTEGCWEVNARAGQSALDFVVWVEP
jgi:hypothetical protein